MSFRTIQTELEVCSMSIQNASALAAEIDSMINGVGENRFSKDTINVRITTLKTDLANTLTKLNTISSNVNHLE